MEAQQTLETLVKIEDLLDEKIPRDVVSLRDGGGGRKLSYLEGWYVIDRLNKVFGPLNWSKEITDVRQVVNTTGRGEFPAYLVKVRLTVRAPLLNNVWTEVAKEGYGYGADKSSQNAHELAIKEAVTDALKVAAKDLGMSMGLALYDKTQENVEDEIESKTRTGNNSGAKATATPDLQAVPGNSATSAPKRTSAQQPSTSGPTPPKTPTTRPEINSLISSLASVAIAKKKESLESIKTHLASTYKVAVKESLTDEQAIEVLEWLKSRVYT